jgi:hypothetical protein
MKVTRLTVIKDKLWNVCTSGLCFLFCGFLGFFLTGKKAVLITYIYVALPKKFSDLREMFEGLLKLLF